MHTYNFNDYIVDCETNKVFIKKTGEIVLCSQEVVDYLLHSFWNEDYNRRKHQGILSFDQIIDSENEDIKYEDVIAAKVNTEKEVIRNQVLADLEELIQSMPEKLQEVYRGRVIDELCQDTAARIGCNQDTITNRTKKIAKLIHTMFEEQGYDLEDLSR